MSRKRTDGGAARSSVSRLSPGLPRAGLCRLLGEWDQQLGSREKETVTSATEREGQPLREVCPGCGRAVTKSRATLKELRDLLKD